MVQQNDQAAVRRQLLSLASLTKQELMEKWKDLFGCEAPGYGPTFLRKRLAYRIQELFYGGLPEEVKRAMVRGEALPEKTKDKRCLMPGTMIVREWHSRRHEVIVRKNGYEYQGFLYRSLSAIAQKITGSHRSGRRFFNLEEE